MTWYSVENFDGAVARIQGLYEYNLSLLGGGACLSKEDAATILFSLPTEELYSEEGSRIDNINGVPMGLIIRNPPKGKICKFEVSYFKQGYLWR